MTFVFTFYSTESKPCDGEGCKPVAIQGTEEGEVNADPTDNCATPSFPKSSVSDEDKDESKFNVDVIEIQSDEEEHEGESNDGVIEIESDEEEHESKSNDDVIEKQSDEEEHEGESNDGVIEMHSEEGDDQSKSTQDSSVCTPALEDLTVAQTYQAIRLNIMLFLAFRLCSDSDVSKRTLEKEDVKPNHDSHVTAPSLGTVPAPTPPQAINVAPQYAVEAATCANPKPKRKRGRVFINGAWRIRSKFCSVEGCERYAVKRGICVRHGAEPPKKRYCRVEGCPHVAIQGGVCNTHGAKPYRKKCNFPGCNRFKGQGRAGFCFEHG